MRTSMLCFVIHFFFCANLFAQNANSVFSITGLDDSVSYQIKLREDLVNEIATFSLHEKSVKIYKVLDIEKTEFHSGRFLEVEFWIHGGSGIGRKRKVVLCVVRKEIRNVLDILSEETIRISKVYNKVADSLKLFDEKRDYQVTLSIKKSRANQYIAILSERTKVESKYDPSQNISISKSYELDFDIGGLFFLNSMVQLTKKYTIYSSKNNNTVDKFINENVPCIQLYELKYVKIDSGWCLDEGQDRLSCF